LDTYFGFINTINSESDVIPEGYIIPKKKEAITESQKVTCSNPVCGRVFDNPIKVKNLGAEQTEPYDACPYCLTEIVLEETHTIMEEKQKPKVNGIEVKEPSMRSTEGKPAKGLTVQGCKHHFGYLSERSSREKMPEECITCEKIVQCMLRNVTG